MALDVAFENLRQRAGISMPAWEVLRAEEPPHL